MRLCPECEPARRAWQENLPQLRCEWGGGALLDARTPNAHRVAEWDRRNAEMIASVEATCLERHQGGPATMTRCTSCDWARRWAGDLDRVRRCPRCSSRLTVDRPATLAAAALLSP